MIEVKDRIPTYPGRVKLIPVEGQDNTYDMVRADEPIEPGTPFNKVLFDSVALDVNTLKQHVDDKLFEISQRTAIKNLVQGSVIGLYENGVLVPYYKATNNYFDSGRALVVRVGITHMDVIHGADYPYYTNSGADLWLNNEFLTRLDGSTRSAISGVSVQVTVPNGITTIYREAFLLSLQEMSVYNVAPQWLGNGVEWVNTPERRIAKYNGVISPFHTRDTNSSSHTSGIIREDGEGAMVDKLTVAGIRPAFTLPLDFEVMVGVPNTANVVAAAEVI